MRKTKRLFLFTFLMLLSITLVACNKNNKPGNKTTNNEAPVIVLNEDSIIIGIDTNFNYLEYVSVTDDVTALDQILIEVSDWGGFDISVEADYVITIEATDEAGNSSTAEITVHVKNDILAPMLTSAVSQIEHLAGESIDLTKGLEGVDNVDGTDVIFSVTDMGDYDADVHGIYVIQITISDSSGNQGQTFDRTIVVSESYSRVEMESFDGEVIRYEALYNPQVFNGNTGTGYNSSYDGQYVNVLSKDYLEWLLEYAPDRLGAGIGWSVITVTNSDDEIVYVRHWNSGEAYTENGDLVSIPSMDWSTGTIRTWSETINDLVVPRSNARYSSGEMGLMMANLNQWVPEDGHVFIFMNWTTITSVDGTLELKANASDMARSMGANYIMNSDEDGDDIKDYALGRTLKILDADLSDQNIRKSFDSESPFPIIMIPSEKYVNDTGVWKERYNKTVYLDRYSGDVIFNPLFGIYANDGKGNDISTSVTYKIYRFKTAEEIYGLAPSVPLTDPLWSDFVDDPWLLSENEVTLDSVLNSNNNGKYFVIEYSVSANGHSDLAYRIIQIETECPDYIDLYGETDTVYSKVMGIETRLEMNPELITFGSFNQVDRGMIFTADYFEGMDLQPVIDEGVAVVLNEYYEIEFVRFLNGVQFEMDGFGNISTEGLTWSNTDLLANIEIPENGYLIVYPSGLNDLIINDAFRAFYDYDYDGSTINTPNQKNGVVEVALPIKEVQELSTLILNDEAAQVQVNGTDINVEVITNNKDALVHNPAFGGAGFRQGTGKVYLYTKDMYEAFILDTEVVTSFTDYANNLGVPWFNNGVIMIFDENNNFIKARLGVGAAAEVNADGTFLFGNEITNWDVSVYTADNENVHGLLKNILNDVPENGYFIIFPTTSASTSVRNFAIELVWNQNYPGGGAIVDALLDPTPDNADVAGFDSTVFTQQYFTDLSLEIDYVASIVDQAAKISKPSITTQENILTWNADSNTGSYDLYVNGQLFMSGVGTLSEDQLTFSVDLSTLLLPEGSLDLQLRAIALDSSIEATSVLSNPLTFMVERLVIPSNIVRNDNVLSWDAVDGATSYFVSINGGDFVEVTTNEIIIPDEDIVDGVEVELYSTGSATLFDSLITEYTLSVEVIPRELVLGGYVIPVKEFIANSWMRYVEAGDVGAQFIEGFVVVNSAEGLLTYDDSTRVFAGGYAVVLDENYNPKYIVDRWGHEWDPVNGWTTNAGGWDYGANLYVSYFRSHLEEGDIIVFASQYSSGLSEGIYRNYFGNALIKDLGVVTTDHRGVDLSTAIDPNTVDISVREVVTTKTIGLGLNDLPLYVFDLDNWLYFIDPTGGNDIGAASIGGIVMIENANGISALDDNQAIFDGGYAAILDSDLNVKYIVDRWGHEWDSVNGWTTNAGAWTYGATLYASYFKPHLAEGDVIILGSQYSNGLPTGTYRNYFGNALIKDLGTYTTDHRNVVLAEAIDPTTITITIKETTSALQIGNNIMDYRSVSLEDWMLYAQNDPGAASIPELVIVNGVENISNYSDTDKVFAGGYVILLDSDMNVKFIVDRWSNVWTSSEGWVEVDTNWAYGANVYVSYFKDLVAAGDILILGAQYENGLLPGASYRDVIGNQVFYDLGIDIYSGDHRNVLVQDAINPTTVIYEIINLD